jgi:hypothetical protein
MMTASMSMQELREWGDAVMERSAAIREQCAQNLLESYRSLDRYVSQAPASVHVLPRENENSEKERT